MNEALQITGRSSSFVAMCTQDQPRWNNVACKHKILHMLMKERSSSRKQEEAEYLILSQII